MTKTWIKSETTRRGLLAGLMLAVLVASIGIAWMLDWSSAKRSDEGAKIIHQIRAKGLKHYWPEKSQIDWFLIQSNGSTIGWKALARVRDTDGNFIGVDVEVIPEQHSSHEIWTLNADATTGTYHADSRSAELRQNQANRGKGFKTNILLDDGVVKVTQYTTEFRSATASKRAPKNYLPEGTLLLAVRQTAGMKTDAQFAMVFNERPNRDKTVEFGTIRLRYLGGKQTRQGQTIHRVRMSEIRGRGKHSTIFELDGKSKILLIQGEKTQSKAVNEQDVEKSFADAPLYLRRILQR